MSSAIPSPSPGSMSRRPDCAWTPNSTPTISRWRKPSWRSRPKPGMPVQLRSGGNPRDRPHRRTASCRPGPAGGCEGADSSRRAAPRARPWAYCPRDQMGTHSPACPPERPERESRRHGSFYVRPRKNARISAASASGCSIAAKCPPFSITVQRWILVYICLAMDCGGRMISRGKAQ